MNLFLSIRIVLSLMSKFMVKVFWERGKTVHRLNISASFVSSDKIKLSDTVLIPGLYGRNLESSFLFRPCNSDENKCVFRL